MRVERQEHGISIIGFLLLFPILLLVSSEPGFSRKCINKLGKPHTLNAFAYKSQNQRLVLKVNGVSNLPCEIEIEIYHKGADASKGFRKTAHHIVSVPSGEIHRNVKIDLESDQEVEKVQVTYFPRSTASKGYLELQVGIF